jgi:hypothetical protein
MIGDSSYTCCSGAEGSLLSLNSSNINIPDTASSRGRPSPLTSFVEESDPSRTDVRPVADRKEVDDLTVSDQEELASDVSLGRPPADSNAEDRVQGDTGATTFSTLISIQEMEPRSLAGPQGDREEVLYTIPLILQETTAVVATNGSEEAGGAAAPAGDLSNISIDDGSSGGGPVDYYDLGLDDIFQTTTTTLPAAASGPASVSRRVI